MAKHADFLVEIHTAELPPKALLNLAEHFLAGITSRLTKLELKFGEATFYATPRRLAVSIKKLAATQPDINTERRGPATNAAFDATGNFTQAALGFARSCGVEPAQLITITNAQGSWLGYQQVTPGKTCQELLPAVVQQALAALPIPKRMRWGSRDIEFVRPVFSALMLYGKEIITADILGCVTSNLTRGHRFHSKGWCKITSAKSYLPTLQKRYVIADFATRRSLILQQANTLVKQKLGEHAEIIFNESLLNEVTGLVEWPVAILGHFAEDFLNLPAEALISVMQDHQRYFAIREPNGKLLPHFITISNIASSDEARVVAGNERVLRARLADANFFYAADRKQSLNTRAAKLAEIIFQAQLGTLADKTQRVTQLATVIASQIGVDENDARRASMLAKADLVTAMVKEFPELQGIMGCYYARLDGEKTAVANALKEHYLPRYSGDELPESLLGATIAIADRIDTLVGIFGINAAPTGDKDPYALRRAALGILRIIIGKKIVLDLRELIALSVSSYADKLSNPNTGEQVLTFLLERFKPWYGELDISPDVLAAVLAMNITQPFDFHRRVHAVQDFKKLPEAAALSVANKRVSNILAKEKSNLAMGVVNENLFEHPAEKALATAIAAQRERVIALVAAGDYTGGLQQLASLRTSVDDFFDQVLVMADNQAVRENRLLLLKQLRELFLYIADIALLQ
jgi:glycyl-tRNA synthetase beta chain